MIEQRVGLVHFTFNNVENGGALAGVERVMETQKRILEARGVQVQMIVGATDARNPYERGILLIPEIQSNPEWGWKNGDVEIDEIRVRLVLSRLSDVLQNTGAVFHNTTNASKHNVPFGIAAARYVTEHQNSVLWIHDLRGSNHKQVRALLPDRPYARLVCVSNARKQVVEHMLQQMEQSGEVTLPPYELLVVPNPIDEQFFQQDILIPFDIRSLAPNYEEFSLSHQLHYDPTFVEQLLFDDHEDVVRFLVPARIVKNKGIHRAISTAREYAQFTGQRTVLIITGPPDLRKEENKLYWEDELLPSLQSVNGGGNFYVIALGGVAWEYMPYLGTRANAVLAPFENEGFCMPLIENGLMGAPSIINQDPAMIETTDGHALIVSGDAWEKREAARSIHEYLSNGKVSKDVRALRQKAWGKFHPTVVAQEILRALNLT